jgi:hypothetical protein
MRIQRYAVAAATILVLLWAAAAINRAAAADDDQYVGTWKGGWEGGGGSGRFDLTVVRGSDGKLSAMVSVGTDMGDYNAAFRRVAFAGDTLKGAYDYPPDGQGEVIVTGTFSLKTATGTWSLGAKGQPDQSMAAGTWKVSKQ